MPPPKTRSPGAILDAVNPRVAALADVPLVPAGMIDLWAHDIGDRAGGIQSYTAAVLDALRGLLGPGALHVSLKHERAPRHASVQGMQVGCYGRVPARLRTGVFALGAAAWALRHRPRLIFSSHPNFAQVGVAIKRWAGTQFWTAAHGIEVWEDCPPLVARALRRADRILAVSEFTKRRMVEGHGVSADRISVLPNTFDAQRFRPGAADFSFRDELGLSRTGKWLLSVGRLVGPERMKGFDRVIEAMPRILQEVPEAVYVIAGTGPDRARLEGIAAACGVREQVKFAGFVPDARLAALYRDCDAFVMPSKKEGFGIVFLEALACGRPVIAGNVDASGEPLLGGELGILVNPENVEQIGDACIRLLARSDENRRLFDPFYLSRRVTEVFGPQALQNTLRELLSQYLPGFTTAREDSSSPH